MRYRYVRIAFSAVCGVVCLLLVALWVRSASHRDEVGIFVPFRTLRFRSAEEQIVLAVVKGNGTTYRGQRALPYVNWEDVHWLYEDSNGFAILRTRNAKVVNFPHWFAVTSVAALSTAPWFPWSLRFGLRTLLVATALTAAILWVIIYAIK